MGWFLINEMINILRRNYNLIRHIINKITIMVITGYMITFSTRNMKVQHFPLQVFFSTESIESITEKLITHQYSYCKNVYHSLSYPTAMTSTSQKIWAKGQKKTMGVHCAIKLTLHTIHCEEEHDLTFNLI